MRLLVTEDDPAIAEGLLYALRADGYAVEWARDGEEAEEALSRGEFDLLILDLGLPKKSGLDVLRDLRARSPTPPVLILTAVDDLQSRVRGLDHGADDFLRKPFELAELKARIRALTRRGQGDRPVAVALAGLSYDRATRVVHVNGERLELATPELMLLEVLLSRTGHLVSHEQIVSQLAEWGERISAKAVDELAQRLGEGLAPGGVAIVSVPALGYSLEKRARP